MADPILHPGIFWNPRKMNGMIHLSTIQSLTNVWESTGEFWSSSIHTRLDCHQPYRWWLKSQTTTLDVWNPKKQWDKLPTSTGAGVQPSTVSCRSLFVHHSWNAPFASHQVTTHNQGCGSKLTLLVCYFCSFLPVQHQMSEKNPGWLGYIGDYTTQLYRDYNKGVLVCAFKDVFLFWGVFRLSTSNHCNSTGRNRPWKGAGWGHFCDSAITVKWQWLNRANFKALV